jgi:DNA-binding transcriptional LysR family regulator
MLAPGLAMAHVIQARLQTAPILHTRTVQTVDSAYTLLPLVRAGLGVAWLPLSLVEMDLRTRTLKRLPDAVPLHVGVRLYRPRHSASPAQALIEKIWRASQPN